MIFADFCETKMIYHVVSITQLGKVLKEGITYSDKNTYESSYLNFHRFIDTYKPSNIPNWVVREKAIFASLNYKKEHTWHSHSVILGIKIDSSKCWYANENLANEVYEPFMLKDVDEFECAKKYLYSTGIQRIRKYWNTSMSFNEGLVFDKNKEDNYDSEILIFHDISPKDIKVVSIISDHKFMSPEKWKKCFEK